MNEEKITDTFFNSFKPGSSYSVDVDKDVLNKLTPDDKPLFNATHSDYCGLCEKNTPCPHLTNEEILDKQGFKGG